MADGREVLLGLDIGQRRIGVAWGDSIGRLAQPLTTLTVDGSEIDQLHALIADREASALVIGLPRNQSGAETAQSQSVRAFVAGPLRELRLPMHFQDESVTSVLAEEQLQQRKKPFTKGDIDAVAASIILQDYLEAQYG